VSGRYRLDLVLSYHSNKFGLVSVQMDPQLGPHLRPNLTQFFKLRTSRRPQFLIELFIVLKRALNFSFRIEKRNETKVAEEYCWAITQAEGRSCYGRSGFSVLEFGFQMDSLVYAYVADHMYTQYRLG
jgi:hypothetical protein